MKKANRKLIPAVVMLLVSAIMLSTASFAWFSMNTAVTAEGMSVKAVATESFLQIRDINDDPRTGWTTKEDYAMTKGQALSPVTPKEAITNRTAKLEDLHWVTTTSSATDNAGILGAEALKQLQDIGSGDLPKYVLHKQMYVRVAPNSSDATDLKLVGASVVKKNLGETMHSVLRVCVASNTAAITFAGDATSLTDVVLVDKLVAGTEYPIDVYIYYDGQDGDCYTDRATTIDDITIGLEFAANGTIHQENVLGGDVITIAPSP